jgi:hypothetical protein
VHHAVECAESPTFGRTTIEQDGCDDEFLLCSLANGAHFLVRLFAKQTRANRICFWPCSNISKRQLKPDEMFLLGSERYFGKQNL